MSIMGLWTIIAVTAVFISSCATPVQKNNPPPEATTTTGTTTYAVDSAATISAETVARLRGIQAAVSKARSDNLLGHSWELLEVDDPSGATTTPYAYYISSLPGAGELMISTTNSDDGHAIIISWLSDKLYPHKNVSQAELSVNGRAKILLSSCTMNMCSGVVPAGQALFEWLREGKSLTFSVDLIDSGTISDQAHAVSGLFALEQNGARSGIPLYGTATIIERTIPLDGIGPILDKIEPPSQSWREAHAQGELGNYLAVRENPAICADEEQPLTKRIASCTVLIDQGGLEGSELAMALVARGRALQEHGDDLAALKDFDNAVRNAPGSESPWIGRANFYTRRSDYSHALDDYNHALSIERGDPVVYDSRGVALSAVGRRDEALADFTHAIALDPHDLHAYFNRATAYLALNRLDLAIADFTVVIRGEPANGMAFYNRGSGYERSGALDKALDDYRSAVRLMPSFAPAFSALARLLKATDTDTALSDLSEAIRLDFHSPALRSRGILYLSMGRPEEALRDFDQVIANDGTDSIAYCDRGVANERIGRLKSAIDDYSRSIELAPTAAALDNRGNAYARLKQPQKALADFSAALALDPNNMPALLGRAGAGYALERLSASFDDYTRVIEADPNNAIAYFNRGNIHLNRGEFAAAFADYSSGLELDPDQAAALVDRAEAAEHMGRREDAERDRRRARTLDPSLAAGEGSSSKK
jgi:tetratricopeptide (TPR) repeat protein